jgi:hypothetical protein
MSTLAKTIPTEPGSVGTVALPARRVELARNILDFLLPAIEAHKARHWNSAPETTVYPDDRWFDWAEGLIAKNEDPCRELILKTTKEDMTELFAALTDGYTLATSEGGTNGFPASAGKREVWPAHRRAFASKIHTYAMELEECGLTVSKGFAEFFRERYNPQHKFHVELPVLAAGSAVDHTHSEANTPCAGCANDQPNQLAHMAPGGCLAPVEEA